MLWSNVIDVARGALFVLAHWFGGSLGAAIFVSAATLRVALMPLTLPAARRRIVRERALRDLAPALEQIKRRHPKRPDLVASDTRELYRAHGISLFDRRDLVGSILPFPPAAALYAAIRSSAAQHAGEGFLWVHSLARPDRMLTIAAAAVTALAARGSGTVPHADPGAQVVPMLLAGAVTFAVLSHFSAGLALYSIANSGIAGLERMIAARPMKPVSA